MVAVLNGVEFRTRHNDYKLRMPSTTSSDYGATEEIPYPDVPPAVSMSTTHYLITRTLLIIDYILALINYRCIYRCDYFVKLCCRFWRSRLWKNRSSSWENGSKHGKSRIIQSVTTENFLRSVFALWNLSYLHHCYMYNDYCKSGNEDMHFYWPSLLLSIIWPTCMTLQSATYYVIEAVLCCSQICVIWRVCGRMLHQIK